MESGLYLVWPAVSAVGFGVLLACTGSWDHQAWVALVGGPWSWSLVPSQGPREAPYLGSALVDQS